MTYSPERIERLKKIATFAVPSVLGAMAVRNIREISRTKHISYWEASQTFIIDLIEDSREGTIRMSGKVLHGPGGKRDVKEYEIYDGFEYSDEDVSRLEEAFIDKEKENDNPLQTG